MANTGDKRKRKNSTPSDTSARSSLGSITSKAARGISKKTKKAVNAVANVAKKVLPSRNAKDNHKVFGKTTTAAAGPSTEVLFVDSASDLDDDNRDHVSSHRATSPEASSVISDDDVPPLKTDVELVDGDQAEEDKLTARLSGWKSFVYAFFEARPAIVHRAAKDSKIVVYYEFECRACHRKLVPQAEGKNSGSTGALGRHVESCWGEDEYKKANATKSLKNSQEIVEEWLKSKNKKLTDMFDRQKASGAESYSTTSPDRVQTRVAFARWVAENLRPFNIPTDRAFRWLMKEGRPEAYILHPTTIANDVRQMFEHSKEKVASELQDVPGTLALSLDCWTAPNHRAWMSICVTYVRDNEPVTHILDFVPLPHSHSGVNMANAVLEVVKEFGIEKKIGTITCDNASNNDAMFNELEIILPGFRRARSQVRCFAHTVNLLAKAFLAQFEVPKRSTLAKSKDKADAKLLQLSDGLEEEQLRAVMNNLEDNNPRLEQDNIDGLVDVTAMMTEDEMVEFGKTVAPMRLVLLKLRKISFKIINSPTLLLPQWYDITTSLGFGERALPRDVPTRWYSTHDMLHGAVKMRKAVEKITESRDNGLRDYELTKEEWECAEELVTALKPLKDATLYFSSKSPNLAAVIPAMDAIEQIFTTSAIDSDTVSKPIRVALANGRKSLNKYYSLTDDVEIYRIAIVLHPSMKDWYFKKQNWPLSWIAEALHITTKVWNDEYKGRGVIPLEDVANDLGSKDLPSESDKSSWHQ